MNITIIGGGAVGSAVSVLCHLGGFDKTELIGRSTTSIVVNYHQSQYSVESKTSAANSPEIVFVATKAFDVEAACDNLVPTLKSSCVIVLLANGMLDEVECKLTQKYSHHIWRRGLVSMGVKEASTGHFEIIGEPKIMWGLSPSLIPLTTTEENIFSTLGSYGFQSSGDVGYAVQKKWLINTSLNSLCGYHRLASNGEALLYENELRQLFFEAYDLAAALFQTWPEDCKKMYGDFLRFLQDVAGNENSMARDVRLGKRTESDFLAGQYLRLSPDQQTLYPTLAKVHQQLTACALSLDS
jgi:2-dehydropantoate 2-reductase